MKRYKIEGGYYLSGDVHIGGSKNACLPIICASLICRKKVRLYNVPNISDVKLLLDILKEYGVYIKETNSYIEIDSSNMIVDNVLTSKTTEFRASYYLLGSLINVFDRVEVYKQGGCKIGDRPIDLHQYAFECLGYKLDILGEKYVVTKKGKCIKKINFEKVSMGATINAILASLSVNEKVKIKNISLEPEVFDVISFLNKCGYHIKVKNKTLIIDKNKDNIDNIEYEIMYDRIEAGSYAILSALIGNNVTIHNFESRYLKSLIDCFDMMNINYKLINDKLIVGKTKKVNNVHLETNPYPNFPTDLFQMISILCFLSDDISVLKDNIYPTRFSQLEEVSKYGMTVEKKKDFYHIYGNSSFVNGIFRGKDLRGTMSLIMYALYADGVSYVYGKEYIDRGYSNMVDKLINIGACIEVEEVEE